MSKKIAPMTSMCKECGKYFCKECPGERMYHLSLDELYPERQQQAVKDNQCPLCGLKHNLTEQECYSKTSPALINTWREAVDNGFPMILDDPIVLVAKQDYNPDKQEDQIDHLNILAGDLIEITSIDQFGFIEGQNKRGVGRFPMWVFSRN